MDQVVGVVGNNMPPDILARGHTGTLRERLPRHGGATLGVHTRGDALQRVNELALRWVDTVCAPAQVLKLQLFCRHWPAHCRAEASAQQARIGLAWLWLRHAPCRAAPTARQRSR